MSLVVNPKNSFLFTVFILFSVGIVFGLVSIQKSSATKSVFATNDQIQGLSTYQNTSLGIKITYPSNWTQGIRNDFWNVFFSEFQKNKLVPDASVEINIFKNTPPSEVLTMESERLVKNNDTSTLFMNLRSFTPNLRNLNHLVL